MNAEHIQRRRIISAVTLSLALILAGCKTQPAAISDADLTTQVQARLASDPNLGGQTVQAVSAGGIVTLTGSVTSDTARTIAGGDVAQITGVRTVVNNLLVQAPPVSASVNTPEPAPMRTEKVKKPTATIVPRPQAPLQPAPIVRNTPAPPSPPPAMTQTQQIQPPSPPPPPPAPVVHNITLPAGTTIPVRITQNLDSATTQTGDKFTGAVASDIVIDGLVVLAQGTPVTGHVDEAKDATHFKGSSLLTISLSSISRKGERVDVATDAFTKEGEGRGKNTAEKVGGGAAVGAILGGIFGGGKGAAIGAAAGGGVGAGAQGITRGQQVQIPSETVVRFRLSDPILVKVSTGGGSQSRSDQPLERRPEQ